MTAGETAPNSSGEESRRHWTVGGRPYDPERDGLDIPDFLRAKPKAASSPKPEQAEMDQARRDRLPAETVDDKVQTRIPLTEDEIAMRSALLAIDAGETIPGDMARHLVGTGFAWATTKKLSVTDEGRAFLAQLVSTPLSNVQQAGAA